MNVPAIENHVGASDINVGFATAAAVSKALKEKKVSQLQALEFRKECTTMLAIIVSKIQERGSLQFHFARKLQSLDPRVMVSKPESIVKMFWQVLKTLVEEKWKTNQLADSELAQFRKLISETKKYCYERFATYSSTQERLDRFFSKLLEKKEEYEQLWTTMKMLLTLSHGQAAVERGFSVNKEVLNPNLQEMSLRAIRLIYSSLSAARTKLAEFHIS